MKFTLTIDTASDAFGPGEREDELDPPAIVAMRRECARILREAADDVEHGHPSGPLRDHNGNTVGHMKWSDS